MIFDIKNPGQLPVLSVENGICLLVQAENKEFRKKALVKSLFLFICFWSFFMV
jgi:hypothetical protein